MPKHFYITNKVDLEQLLEETQRNRGRLVFVGSETSFGKSKLILDFLQKHTQDFLIAIAECQHIKVSEPYYPFKLVLAELNASAISDNSQEKKSISAKLLGLISDAGPDWIAAIPILGAMTAAGVRTLQAMKRHFGKKEEKNKYKLRSLDYICQQYEEELRRLAQNAPLIILLNNIQWADSSSLNLLFTLDKSMKERPFPLLIICNYFSQIMETEESFHRISFETISASAPSPPPNFTGRRNLIATVGKLLKQQSPVAIALQGMGGIGKTVTAKKIAAELTPAFPGGIFWASLPDSDGDPLPILRTWAHFCSSDLPSDLDSNAMATLVRGLLVRRKNEFGEILLIVDDVRKDWLKGAQLLKDTLPTDSSILFTTREKNLAYSLDAVLHQMDILPENEAFKFLSTIIGKKIVENNHDEISAILKALGYLPLGIELAGKSLALLLHKPGFKLRLFRQEIKTSAINVLHIVGHPELASIFETTYNNLKPTAQKIFRWLGAFASGQILLEDIVGIIEKSELFDIDESTLEIILDNLIQLSLVNWGTLERSYKLHPLLHQYAQMLLNRYSEREIANKCYITYYSRFFPENIEIKITFHLIEPRLTNFLNAAKKAHRLKYHNEFLRLVKLLGRTDGYLYVRGYWDKASYLLKKGIEVSEDLGDINTSREILWHLGTIMRELGEYTESRKLFQISIERNKEISDNYFLANSLFGLGYVYIYLYEFEYAESLLKETIQIAEIANNDYALGEALRGLGRVYLSQNNLNQAQVFFERSLPILEKSINIQGLIYALRGLGTTQLLNNNIKGALDNLIKALKIAESIQDKQAMSYTLRAMGETYLTQTHFSTAKEVFSKSIELCRSIGEQAGLAASLCLKADSMIHLDEFDNAEKVYQESGSLAETIGSIRWKARSMFGLAKIYLKRNLKSKAFETAKDSLRSLLRARHRDASIIQEWIKKNFS